MTQPEFEASSYTDIGKVRQTNEDYYGHYRTVNGEVFVICDGMGGHLGGATAARMASESIRVFFDHQRYENPIEALRQAFMYANSKVFAASQQSPELEGMGTTCVVMLVRDGVVYYAHIGDSRLYRFTHGRLLRLTKDHTFVQQLVDRGEITTLEVLSHPRRHELTQALGIDQDIDVEIGQLVQPHPGDIFMLCSDGLSGIITDDGISQVLSQSVSVDHKAKQLVEMANHASGADNITVQVIGFQSQGEPVVTEPLITPPLNVFDFPPTPTPTKSEISESYETPRQNTYAKETASYQTESTDTKPNPNQTISEEPVKKTSSRPDLALILLCGLAAITIGLFIAGWKYISSDPVESSELSSVQANTETGVANADTEATEDAGTDETETPTNTTEETTPVATPIKKEEPKEEAPKKEEPKPKVEKPKTEETPKATVSIPAGGTTITHTVKAGETFRGIANRYNLKYETLKALNPQIKDVEKDMKSDVTKLKVKVKAEHVVGAGDILSVVSKKYGVSKSLIMAANKKTADRTERGEKLVIPLPEKQ